MEILNKHKIKIIIGIFVILTIIVLKVVNQNKTLVMEVESEIETMLEEEEEPTEDIYYRVDIKGSVSKPGVYSLLKDSRVIDVVNLAGGYTKDADTSLINLSKKIQDEMVIIIYNKDIVRKINEENKTKTEVEKLIIKPNDLNEVTVKKEDLNIINQTVKQEVKKETSTNSKTTTEELNENQTNNNDSINVQDDKININTASLEQLMTLTGIGEAKASKIIEYRIETPFKSIEEITNVSGIGETAYEKIKDFICI